MLQNIKDTYQRFPKDFWILMLASFIDNVGGAILFPFFTIYVTSNFNVGMQEAGLLFTIFAVTHQFGSLMGGALTDRFGRKGMIIFGLVTSALASVWMGLVNELNLFYLGAAFAGLLASAGDPAQQAMVADLLPEEQRAEGYGIKRVVSNLAVTLGPLIGGLLASKSFLIIFLGDAVTSIIMAVIVFMTLPETKPETPAEKTDEKMVDTFKGYFQVARDRVFIAFVVISVLVNTVYVQMNSSLAVYLRDVHNIPIIEFGYILSLNAGMVVAFQFWVTSKITKRPPLLMLAFGTLLYAIGFGMYGFVSGFTMFAIAMAIITIGEMVIIPIAQAVVAKFAPEDMRGRYMAIYGISWTIPFAVGPLMAGIIMDNYNPNWVWYGSGIIGIIAVIGYIALHLRASHRFKMDLASAETSS